jgi:hypothetical protein
MVIDGERHRNKPLDAPVAPSTRPLHCSHCGFPMALDAPAAPSTRPLHCRHCGFPMAIADLPEGRRGRCVNARCPLSEKWVLT